MHGLICMRRPTFLLFVLERDAPGDEVSSSAALLGDDLPHLVMAVGALEGCLRGGGRTGFFFFDSLGPHVSHPGKQTVEERILAIKKDVNHNVTAHVKLL